MNSPAAIMEVFKLVTTALSKECRAVTGFDGFVDEMISLVGERRSLELVAFLGQWAAGTL